MPTNGARTPSTSSIGSVAPRARAAREAREVVDHVIARADRVRDRVARAQAQHADRGLAPRPRRGTPRRAASAP